MPSLPKHSRLDPEDEDKLKVKHIRKSSKISLHKRSYRAELRNYAELQEARFRELNNDLEHSERYLRKAEKLEREAEELLSRAERLRVKHEEINNNQADLSAIVRGYSIRATAARNLLNLPGEMGTNLVKYPPKVAVRAYLAMNTGDIDKVQEILINYLESQVKRDE